MLNIRKACWGMLGVMVIGSIEPIIASAAIPETKPVVHGKLRLADNLADVLRGNSTPTSFKLKELTPEWRAMSTNGQFEFGNLQTFVGTFASGSFATNYYTKGQTVTIGSETYVVAYSLLSIVEKVSPETPLNLSLLNLKTIGSLTNIRAFEPIAETKVLEKQLAALQLANVFDPTKVNEDKDKPDITPPVTPPKVKPIIRKKRTTTRKTIRRTKIIRRINR
jgi:hypothetical protein